VRLRRAYYNSAQRRSKIWPETARERGGGVLEMPNSEEAKDAQEDMNRKISLGQNNLVFKDE